MTTQTRSRLSAAALLLGLVAVGYSVHARGSADAPSAQPVREVSTRPSDAPSKPLDPAAAADLHAAQSLSRAFNHAADAIGPSVVHITQIRDVMVRRNFFDPGSSQPMEVGAGSGVIVTPDGYILTNNHVIEGASAVKVKLNDGRELSGKVVGTDPATDLGVVKVTSDSLVAAEWGDSDSLYVGEWVLAVGSPFGQFDNTFTAGIVSAKNRTGLQGSRDERFEDFIQTDAAINPGNSGGPLVNLEGKVVGINSQIATRNGGNVGLGFSIPASISRPVMEMIVSNGRVERGWIGIGMSPAEPGTRGVVINRVVDGGPANEGGLKESDIVTRFNGRDVDSLNRLKNAIAFTPLGTEAKVDVLRSGKPMTLNVRVVDTNEGRAMLPGGATAARYGFTVDVLPRRMAQQLGVEAVYVNYISQLGAASDAKLQVEDVILSVNNTNVGDAGEFDKAIKAAKGGKLRLDVYRPSTSQRGIITVTPRDARSNRTAD